MCCNTTKCSAQMQRILKTHSNVKEYSGKQGSVPLLKSFACSENTKLKGAAVKSPCSTCSTFSSSSSAVTVKKTQEAALPVELR